MGGKEAMLMKLVAPPVVRLVTTRLVALKASATEIPELVRFSVLILGCAAPVTSVPFVIPTGLVDSVNAADSPATFSVAPLNTETDGVLGIAPEPLKASTPLLTTVAPE